MSRNLHVAKVWQIEYKYPGMKGSDDQDAFYNSLEMFEVENSADDIYTNDFEVERAALQDLRRHISEQDEVFQKQAEDFQSELEKIDMTREKFIAILDNLINDSDQWDAYVHLSWF